MQEDLNSPQLHLFDKAVTLLMDKQRYQQQLTSQISITLSPQSPSESCLSKLVCLSCLKTQKQQKQFEKKFNQTKSIKAILTNREENDTLFCIRLQEPQDDHKQFIGSWYDVLIFSEWQNKQTQEQVLSTNMIEQSQENVHQNDEWYSKIIIWFSSFQFTLVFYDRKQHQHIFQLFITLKEYYTKFHPESQYNSLILRHYVEYNGDRTNQLTEKEIAQLIRGMNFNQKDFLKHLNQVEEYNLTKSLTRDGFMKLISVMQCPYDLFKIFCKFSKSFSKTSTKYEMYSEQRMSSNEFKRFIEEVQKEKKTVRPTSISFLGQSGRKSRVKSQSRISDDIFDSTNLPQNLSFIAFCQYILSLSKNPVIEPKQIDQNHPLPEYYINSSHNTYLVGNQLTSISSANIYYLNLMQGMRCVELDIHDSPHGPIIKHGYTLTAQITFEDAINSIMKFCYENPEHTPIVLSFENHCTQKNRKKMANVLDKIPKNKFYSIPETANNLQKFPKLKQLKGKIIIQGTGIFQQLFPKIKFQEKNFTKTSETQLKPQDILNLISQPQNFLQYVLNQEKDDRKQTFEKKAKKLQNMKYSFQQKISGLISKISSKYGSKKDQFLAEYYGIIASPFNLQNSCWEMANIAQNNIIKMINGEIRPTPEEIYKYSSHSLIRIYPFGLRFNSSNFNTIPMLQCGCQLVSLNTQNVDVYYVMMQGLFEKNRNCGYAKKKDFKRQDQKKYQVKIIFMDCLDLRPRRLEHMSSTTSLQVSFVGSQEDMKENCKYVNYQNSAKYIEYNEPVTISYSVPCKNLQSQFRGIGQFQLNDPPRILKDVSETRYPFVDLSIKSIDFANLYINLMHCGSISIPLADVRQGLRIVPIYCYEIGRKKRMGNLLIYVQINVSD